MADDCFPYPRTPSAPPIQAPCPDFAGKPYSLSGPYTLANYSSSQVNPLDGGSSQVPSNATTVTWLFFGLASEALGRDVYPGEFLENGPGTGKYIDVRIPKWFWIELHKRWGNLEDTCSSEEFDEIKDELCSFCEKTLRSLDDFDFDRGDDGSSDLGAVLLSVHMLIFVIQDLLPMEQRRVLAHDRLLSTRILFQRMIRNGWCRKRLIWFQSRRLSYPSLYFLSSVSPTHGRIMDHSTCTDGKCQVATPLETPLHRTKECRCANTKPRMDDVIRILKEGGIPLVKINLRGDTPELEVIQYSPAIPFIAISHVWSDRNFGSEQNSLPKCQVLYLYSSLQKLPPATCAEGVLQLLTGAWESLQGLKSIAKSNREWFFWLDTFCIPQEERYKDLQSSAIDTMNFIYAAADQTLVFDAGLQNLDVGAEPASRPTCSIGRPAFLSPAPDQLVDTLAHIFGSTWMGRAWTLQEGVVSKFCVFLFSGSFAHVRLLHTLARTPRGGSDSILKSTIRWIPVGGRRKKTCSICRTYGETSNKPLTDTIALEILDGLKWSLDIKEQSSSYPREPNSRVADFINSYRSLQSRTTTKPKDLLLILANLSSLNGNFISQIEDRDKQIRVLIYAVGIAPLELLFSNCPKIGKQPGDVDGWIPKEIIPENFSDTMFLKLGRKGFNFQFDKGSQLCRFILVYSCGPQPARFILSYQDQLASQMTYEVQVLHEDLSRLAIPSNASICMLIYQPLEDTDFRGAMFLVTRVEGDEIFLRYVCAVKLRKTDRSTVVGSATQKLEGTVFIQPGASKPVFILEKSSMAEININRPRSPEKYEDRINIFMHIVLPSVLSCVNLFPFRWLGRFFSTDTTEVIKFSIVIAEHILSQRLMELVCYRAWRATYQHSWRPNGPWKWFWWIMNFNSPISVERFGKFVANAVFTVSFQLDLYGVVAATTLCWLPLFDGYELAGLYVLNFAEKALLRLFL